MTRRPSSARAGWFAPLLLLLAGLLAFGIVRARPPALLGWVLGLLAAVPVLWALVSALFPARAERRCPACSADELARLDPRSTLGLACSACGWRDESASAWLLAEEEGPLEELVLAQRAGVRAGRAVDSPGEPG